MDVTANRRVLASWVAALVLLAVTAGLYARTVAYPYVYEDKNFPTAFAHPWPAAQYGPNGEAEAVSYTLSARTFTLMSYAVTHRWLDTDAHGDHLGNIALHLLAGTLLFAAAWPLLGPLPALTAAGLFLLWPTQTETVAYVSGRADLMVACGLAVALLGLARGSWLVVMAGWLLACLSKEVGLMTIGLTLLVAWWQQRPVPKAILWTCFACAALAALWLWSLKLTHFSLAVFPAHLTQWTRLLGYLAWPAGLSILHDWTWITPTIATGVMVGWLAAFWFAEKRRDVLFVLGFCLLAILPRLFAVDAEPLHEHHTYLASMGIWLGAGKAVWR